MRGPSRFLHTTNIEWIRVHLEISLTLSPSSVHNTNVPWSHHLPSVVDIANLCARGCTLAPCMTTIDHLDDTGHLQEHFVSLQETLLVNAWSSCTHHTLSTLHRQDPRWENTHFTYRGQSLRGFPGQDNLLFNWVMLDSLPVARLPRL